MSVLALIAPPSVEFITSPQSPATIPFRMPYRRYPTESKSIRTTHGVIAYTLARSPRRRTIEIQIAEDGAVRVRAPRYSSEKDIQDFILLRTDWILKHVQRHVTRHNLIKSKAYGHGHEFLFLGRKYRLAIEERRIKRPRIAFTEEGWRMTVPEGLSALERERLVQRHLWQWYQEQAKEVFGSRVFEYGRRMSDMPEDIVVKTQRRIWGSCDARKRVIHLNWHLVMCPMSVIDYVVVHELAHLKVQDHSSRFWKRVAEFYPDYNDQRQWLKDNAVDMALPTLVK